MLQGGALNPEPSRLQAQVWCLFDPMGLDRHVDVVAVFTCLWHGLKGAHGSGAACGGLRGKVSNSIVRQQVVPQERQPRKGGRLCLHFVGRARKSWRAA